MSENLCVYWTYVSIEPIPISYLTQYTEKELFQEVETRTLCKHNDSYFMNHWFDKIWLLGWTCCIMTCIHFFGNSEAIHFKQFITITANCRRIMTMMKLSGQLSVKVNDQYWIVMDSTMIVPSTKWIVPNIPRENHYGKQRVN